MTQAAPRRSSGEVSSPTGPRWLAPAFFASGFAAVIYQVVWQRALYAIFGINIESVTIVVTAFLSGLGLGSFVGGAMSRAAPLRNLRMFAAAEAGIAIYGAASLAIFHRVGDWTLGASSMTRAIATLAVLVIPTALMGATLPMLVAYVVRSTNNVGNSVSGLYFVNTAGSGLAALASVLVVLGSLGERGSVLAAALINACVAGFALSQTRTRGA